MKRACGAGRSSWFTGINGEIDAAVDGIVILVGGWGLTGVFSPPPGRIIVCVIDKGDAGRGVFYPKLWVGHEVVDGWSGVWFFQAFIEGATECIHNADLSWERGKHRQCQKKKKWRDGGKRKPWSGVEKEEEEEVKEQEKKQLQSVFRFHTRCLQFTNHSVLACRKAVRNAIIKK